MLILFINDRGMSDMNGVCGGSCAGVSGIDTIGVYEFDTVSETVISTHVMKEGFGGDPYPSPDGSEYHNLLVNSIKCHHSSCIHHVILFYISK